MIGQTNSIGFGDKSNNIYYAGVGADLNLFVFPNNGYRKAF
jgi:hypothetical protein